LVISWEINATGANNTQYEVDLFVNSSYGSAKIPDNHTSDSTVCIGPCPSAEESNAITLCDASNVCLFIKSLASGIAARFDSKGNTDIAGTLSEEQGSITP